MRLSTAQARVDDVSSTPPRSRYGVLALLAFEFHVLVRPGPRVTGDEPDARLLHPWPQTGQARVQPDRRDDRLVVDELLDAVQGRLAPLRVELARRSLNRPSISA